MWFDSVGFGGRYRCGTKCSAIVDTTTGNSDWGFGDNGKYRYFV
jgi:hypothetical protein